MKRRGPSVLLLALALLAAPPAGATTISITGTDGIAGADGADGNPGANGAAGGDGESVEAVADTPGENNTATAARWHGWSPVAPPATASGGCGWG